MSRETWLLIKKPPVLVGSASMSRRNQQNVSNGKTMKSSEVVSVRQARPIFEDVTKGSPSKKISLLLSIEEIYYLGDPTSILTLESSINESIAEFGSIFEKGMGLIGLD
ncbi:MAG: hypothetical protein ACE5OZ_15480 [Candidatus Heimdallarchaeota archaeon]